ncbi:MAG: urease accessory protein UreD [Pseudomonadota bacterium]
MYASTSQSDLGSPMAKPAHQRVCAAAAVSFKQDGGKTRLDSLYQRVSAKIRFPKNYDQFQEAVLINTAGGLTGGDQLDWNLKLGQGANVVSTTQACEKAYRSHTGTAHVRTNIHLEAESVLHWLPQETILYDASSLERNFTITLEQGSQFLGVEAIVLGREAMGETISELSFRDRWRITQKDKLIFADETRLDADFNSIARMNEAGAMATLVFICEEDDEQLKQRVSKLRSAINSNFAAISGFNNKITGRFLAHDSYALRQILIPVLKEFRGQDLPRVWRI